ncbi:MAG: TetR/AcrR family transcriptional regulator [Myxococcales bacterium]|nr:TetR/AcrR family transcriptional regulator [Myxococcales bacterium]
MKLLRAAMEVMGAKGPGSTTIQEITDAADVGFGSFYNYFASKDAILDALMDEVVDAFGAALDGLAEVLDDPAEILAASIRHMGRRAADDPAWGWFVLRTAFARDALQVGLGPRMLRDLRRGIEAKRFRTDDLVGTGIAIGGLVLAISSARLHGQIGEDSAERAATLALALLGIPTDEAAEVARRPLPEIDRAR